MPGDGEENGPGPGSASGPARGPQSTSNSTNTTTTTTAAGRILAHTYIALQLPSGYHKVVKILPDTVISLGKYGSFHSNLLLGRPFHLTFEVVDRANQPDQASSELRVVPASELHAENLADDALAELRDDGAVDDDGDGEDALELDQSSGDIILRNNRLTVDDPSRQTLSMADIEELKKGTHGSGKAIISKVMQSHSALDEKTAFSLAKYILRKSKKYMRRFTVLPLDVSKLTQWMLSEKEPARIMELREEILGLIASWSNVHCARDGPTASAPDGRWLVVDDTGGLIVAALAERMDILHPPEHIAEDDDEVDDDGVANDAPTDPPAVPAEAVSESNKEQGIAQATQSTSLPPNGTTLRPRRRQRRHPPDAMSATSNTITLLHSATQPNISMLSYFLYNPNDISALDPYPSSKHPLHTHLKTVSWLQLLSPHLDGAYTEPESVDADTLATWKTSKRSNYFRKRRRWECTKRVVDETRAGGFDGLVVASSMDATTILHYVVPLLKGGAQVVVYHPNVEPLAELMDMYSSPRKSAFLNLQRETGGQTLDLPSDDFPLDPRLLLAPSLQTVRAREWQVLPGRTHPVMTGQGGPEGYLFTATRVLPVEGNVEARGKYTKKRKATEDPHLNGVDKPAEAEANDSGSVDTPELRS